MINLLVHVSNYEILDFIKPSSVLHDQEAVCFSKNLFLSDYGSYVYLFDYQKLQENYCVRNVGPSEWNTVTYHNQEDCKQFGLVTVDEIKLSSSERVIKNEYRIYTPVAIKDCLAIVRNRYFKPKDIEIDLYKDSKLLKTIKAQI